METKQKGKKKLAPFFFQKHRTNIGRNVYFGAGDINGSNIKIQAKLEFNFFRAHRSKMQTKQKNKREK